MEISEVIRKDIRNIKVRRIVFSENLNADM